MNEKVKSARPGSIMVRINHKFYEVPDNFLFKSYDNKDLYLSGVRREDNNWISTVKFIEEDRVEDVPTDLLEKFLKLRHRKIIIDDEEYDIPVTMYHDCKVQLVKVSKRNPKVLKDLKETYKDYIFKK